MYLPITKKHVDIPLIIYNNKRKRIYTVANRHSIYT